jgi:hypothetical protein
MNKVRLHLISFWSALIRCVISTIPWQITVPSGSVSYHWTNLHHAILILFGMKISIFILKELILIVKAMLHHEKSNHLDESVE